MADPDNTVSLVISGQSLTGWQSIRIGVSCEKIPSDFDVMMTERNPDSGSLVDIPAGAPCQVMIGGDLVVTGYVDRRIASIGPRDHEVRVQGRGKCEDLVDCSVTPDILNGMQVTTSSLLDLAQKITKPFGVPPRMLTTSSLTGNNVPVAAPNGGAPLTFNANLQETPYEILEEVARYAGVLLYEGTDGNLIIANVGTSTMASGFAQGVNVQTAVALNSMDERFSEYWPMLMSTMFFGQEGVGGVTYPKVFDPGVPRFRPLVIVSEQVVGDAHFAEIRALWEMKRRWGRSQVVQVTCDSWRDSAGRLWAPNAFAPIVLPSLKQSPSEPWIIGHINFVRDLQRGTVADVTLMPKEAFQPEPLVLMPMLPPDSAGGGAGATQAQGSPDYGDNPTPPSSAPPAGGGSQARGTPAPATGGAADAATGPGGILGGIVGIN